jgi:hypothetical protein
MPGCRRLELMNFATAKPLGPTRKDDGNMRAVGSLGQEVEESSQTFREFFAEIEAVGGPAMFADDHRFLTAGICAD